MLKLSKKWIFSFLGSFFITFVLGFFIWSFFVIPDISSNDFTASLSDTNIVNLNQEETPQQIEPAEEILLSEEIPNIVIEPEVSLQDKLDDIQEKLDIISQKVQLLIEEQNPTEEKIEVDEEEIKEEEELKEDDLMDEEKDGEISVCTGQININTASTEDLEKIISVGPVTAQKIILARPFYSLNDLLKVSGIGEVTLQKITEQGCAYVEPGLAPPVLSGGGGGNITTYPKILISEVQISPINNRFIELYNPNNENVNLTDWYLQRKTQTSESWGSLISSTKFEGKIIPAGGYFLISRELENSDILFDITLSDGNSLAFKNPNGEISDKLGFGSALDFESLATTNPTDGQSIGRKFINETEQDTNDNFSDFELQTLTPKAQNITYVEPSPPPIATLKSIAITTSADKLDYFVGDLLDISGLVVTGTYSDEGTKIEAITLADITGFDSSTLTIGQLLTITLEGKTATYEINITEVGDIEPPSIMGYTLNGSADNIFFNPNINNNIPIVITASEQVKWTSAKIYKIDDPSVYKSKNPSGDGTITGIMSWDGTLTKPATGLIFNGTYAIEVHIVDLAGNDISGLILSPYMITVDTIAPIITLNGDSTINLIVGSEYAELGATTDDGSIVNVEGSVDTTTVGSYNVIYNAIDLAGNESIQVIRTVEVRLQQTDLIFARLEAIIHLWI